MSYNVTPNRRALERQQAKLLEVELDVYKKRVAVLNAELCEAQEAAAEQNPVAADEAKLLIRREFLEHRVKQEILLNASIHSAKKEHLFCSEGKSLALKLLQEYQSLKVALAEAELAAVTAQILALRVECAEAELDSLEEKLLFALAELDDMEDCNPFVLEAAAQIFNPAACPR